MSSVHLVLSPSPLSKWPYSHIWMKIVDQRMLIDASRQYGTFQVKKIGQHISTPRSEFYGINHHYWTWGNAFWPLLAPPDPWGGVRGGMGGSRGVPGTKNCNFFWSHIWVTNWEILDFMNWKHFIFQVFGQKWPLRRPKMVVFGLKWVNTKVHFSQKHPL